MSGIFDSVVLEVRKTGCAAQKYSCRKDQVENMKRVILDNELWWTARDPQKNKIYFKVIEE